MTKRLKLLMVTPKLPPEFAGYGITSVLYATELAKTYDVDVLTTTQNPTSIKGVNFVPINLPGWFSKGKLYQIVALLYLPFLRAKLSKLIGDNYDFIFSIGTGHWIRLLCLHIAHKKGIMSIAEPSLYGHDDPVFIKKKRFGWIRRWLLTKADKYVAMSPLMKDIYLKDSVVKDKEIAVIGNPVDLEKFKPVSSDKKSQLRTQFGFSEKDFILLFVGGVRKRKGIDKVIDLMPSLIKQNKNVKLLVVGPVQSNNPDDVQFVTEIEQTITENKLGDSISMVGFQPNVEDYMQLSDVFVFPSHQEGFGTVQIEAMACGLPVVAYEIKRISEFIIDNGVDGFYVGDQNEMLKHLLNLMTDSEQHKAISTKAMEKVNDRFEISKIIEEYVVFFEK
ncbi:MAG: glycosyltransferase family 4 protein [Cyclobacteriaceae bacterium]